MFPSPWKTAALLFAACSFYITGIAQDCTKRLAGHVEDADTKEKLPGATVYIVELEKSIITDDKGDFTFFNLCDTAFTLRVSHVNCDTVFQRVALKKNMHVDINLPHFKNTFLENVTVTTQLGPTTSGYREQLKGRELEASKGISISDAFSKINGVTLLQTGSTISKPVLHGLHSNRILTINNGVRQEGQQWGNEHAPEIDAYVADNLEVIKGVDELRYGSDAVGGVILINPKPLRFTPGYYAELNGGYFTNNRQYIVSGMYEQTFKKLPAFSYRIQGTFKKGANIKTPDYRLNNTAIQEQNFSLAAGWKKEKYNIDAFYSQFKTKLGIFTGSHAETRSDLQTRIDSVKPNDVFLGENTYKIERPYQSVLHQLLKLRSGFDAGKSRFTVQFASQFNHRQEFDIVRNQNLGAQLNLRIATWTEDVAWEHPSFGNLKGSVGIAAMQQDNWYSGRYFIPNYTSYSYGAYWFEKWSKHKWELQGGLRFDIKSISTERIKSDSSLINHDFDFSTFASSFNATYKLSNRNKVNAAISLSSRAPYVNELLSDGIHQGDAVYYLGNINLTTERAIKFLANYSYQNNANTFSADISAYCNFINNFIYLQPKPGEPVQTISGAYPLYVFEQADARLTGLDVAARVNLTKELQFSSKLALLRAWNRELNDWLILMPSDRLNNKLTFNFNDSRKLSKTYISAEVATVFTQTRVPSDKNGPQDYAPPPQGYTLLNLDASTTIQMGKLPVTVGIGGRNLLNKQYREYMNTFRYFTDEMGRNINLRFKIQLEHLL